MASSSNSVITPPPFSTPFLDPKTGAITLPWVAWLSSLTAAGSVIQNIVSNTNTLNVSTPGDTSTSSFMSGAPGSDSSVSQVYPPDPVVSVSDAVLAPVDVPQPVTDSIDSLRTELETIKASIYLQDSSIPYGMFLQQANNLSDVQSQQAALNNIAGTQTNKYYLRSNGTNVSMSALQAADLSGQVAVANGGTGTATPAIVAGTNIAVSGSFPNQTVGVTGTLASSNLPTPTTSLIGGVKAIAAVSHQWINSIDTTGTPSLSQPAFTDISGTVASTQLPTASTSAFGGYKDVAAVAHKWVASSSGGVPVLTQPNFTDIAASAASTWSPTLTPSGSMTFSSTTTVYATYWTIGNLTWFSVYFYGTIGGTLSNQIQCSLPVSSANIGGNQVVAAAYSPGNSNWQSNMYSVIGNASSTLYFSPSNNANFAAGITYFQASGVYRTT